ncbi:MAG: methyltransferase domain-containing protein [Myxococcales bacterium]|nr:methyltransferase domain-containing protein [Myxococcales bacterium]
MADSEGKAEGKPDAPSGLVSDIGTNLENMNTSQRRRRKLARSSELTKPRTVTHPMIVAAIDDPGLVVSMAYGAAAMNGAVTAPAVAHAPIAADPPYDQSNPDGIAQPTSFGDSNERTMEIEMSQVAVISPPRTSTFSLAEDEYEELEDGATSKEIAVDAPGHAVNVATATPSPAVPPALPRAVTNRDFEGKDLVRPASAVATPPPSPPAPPVRPPPAPKRPEARSAALAAAATAEPRPKKKPHAKPWFEEVFEEDYLRTLPFLTPKATQAEAVFIMQSLGLQPGASVLDVGSGYGRHALELAARGMQVVAFDLSLPLLLRGADEAERRGLAVQFVHGDMRDLDFDAQFDGAYCWFSTFGYFDDDNNRKTAANICRALKPGARVVIEVLNRDYIVSDLPTRVWWEGDGCVVLEEVEFNYFTSRLQSSRSVVFDDGRQLEQELSIRSYSLHELGKLLHAAGFKVVDVSGNLATPGRFLGPLSRHLIVVAEKRVDADAVAPSEKKADRE